MKKVLIVTASMGGGHNAAARALAEASKKFPDIKVLVLDLNGQLDNAEKRLMISSYQLLAGKLPLIWKFLYQATNTKLGRNIFGETTEILSALSTQSVAKDALAFQPDFILSTHFFAPYFFNNTPLADVPLAMVVTDYTWHEIWHHPLVNEYFVATDQVKDECLDRADRAARFITSGIPVAPEFYNHKNTAALRSSYNISQEKPVILLLTGGTGLADTTHLIAYFSSLTMPVTVVAITGKNPELKQKFDRMEWPKNCDHRVIGWTTKIADYMRLADVIIGKPGGLAVSECVALGKPMIITSPVPGPEEANAAYLESTGLGRVALDAESVMNLTEQFLKKPWGDNAKKNLPATEVIWQTILKQIQP